VNKYNIFPESLAGYSLDPDKAAIRVGTAFKITAASTYKALGIRTYIGSTAGVDLSGCWAMLYGYVPQALLATKAFPATLALGWNEVLFDTPVSLPGGASKLYGAVVYYPHGGFSYKHFQMSSAVQSSELTTLFAEASAQTSTTTSNGVTGNGFYTTGSIADPTNPANNPSFWDSFNAAHYGPDIIATDP